MNVLLVKPILKTASETGFCVLQSQHISLEYHGWCECTRETGVGFAHVKKSRFKSQVLLDEQALLSCVIYVDLNPIRAGITDTFERSEYTSIQQGIENYSHKLQKNTKTANNRKKFH